MRRPQTRKAADTERGADARADDAVARALESGWYILGNEGRAFEAEFGAWLGSGTVAGSGAGTVVGCGNGTDAIALALRGLGIGAGCAVATVSHTAVATAPASGAARATTNLVAQQPHRETELQHFGVGQARVGHVGLDHIGAIKARACTAAARDGLVVLVALIAEGEIVHRGLATRHHTQCAIQGIGNTA